MASRGRAYADNAPGSFFVDDTCIDCDTCRQVAPLSFVDAGGHSVVAVQPVDDEAVRQAARAVVCCPTNSIGTAERSATRAAIGEFPLPIAGGVHYCGFNAESSFGANSYFIQRADGNWLVDAPRWMPALADAFAARGGLAGIFLTHRDDVADAARYAERFGARRVIHRRDESAAPGAEVLLEGEDARELAPGLVAVPTPGHTAGHCVLHVDDEFLFTGDHLWWSRKQGRLVASRSVCWHSWPEQTRSVERLRELRFSWILPGHGQRAHAAPERMRDGVAALALRMRAESAGDDW